MRIFLHILTPLVILFIGIMIYLGLKKQESITILGKKIGQEKSIKPARKPSTTNRPKFKTKAIPLQRTNHTIKLQSQGEIRTHNATTLTAQISGRITNLSEKFEDGAFFQQGDILAEIDPADYNTELASAEAQLARAEASFAQEKARAKQALLNWKDAGFTEEPSDLVLRKPQLRQAEAAVTSATSAVERAQRNLKRTKIRAPYDGRVRKRNVGLGQQISGSTALGEIFSTDFAEVRLPLTNRDLQYYTPPQKPGERGQKNHVTFTSILNTSKTSWQGTILRAEGELDQDSRQLFIIARIDDPFALKSKASPLYIGQPVRATIPAKELQDVYTISRKHMIGLNEVLLIREGKLKRVEITALWSGPETIVTRNGIEPGDQLAISSLPYAAEDAPVEIIPDSEAAQQNGNESSRSKHVGRKHTRPKK